MGSGQVTRRSKSLRSTRIPFLHRQDWRRRSVRPIAAWYSPDKGEFLLLYEDVRSADAPEKVLWEFLQSTYEAGATLAKWDREALEREAPSPDGTHAKW